MKGLKLFNSFMIHSKAVCLHTDCMQYFFKNGWDNVAKATLLLRNHWACMCVCKPLYRIVLVTGVLEGKNWFAPALMLQ